VCGGQGGGVRSMSRGGRHPRFRRKIAAPERKTHGRHTHPPPPPPPTVVVDTTRDLPVLRLDSKDLRR